MSKAKANLCFEKARARDDEIFPLVGQDRTSPRVVCEWIKENIETAPVDKLFEALDSAIAMRNTHIRKVAD